MFRKVGGIFILFALLVGLIVPVTSAQEEPIELSIVCDCSESLKANVENFVIPEFTALMEAQGKNVVVELVSLDMDDEQYKEQLALDFTLGEGSDVVGFDGFWTPEFVNAGLLKPLDEVAGEVVNEWEGWDHIAPGVQAVLAFQDERYGVPQGTDVRLLFYRTDVFEAAGIETPWQPTSWEELIDTARTLKEAGVEIPFQLNAGTLFGEATTLQGYFMALLGTGIHMYDFDQDKWIVSHPGILQALELYQTIYSEGLGSVDQQMTDGGRDDSFTAFQEGRVGIYAESDYLWRSVASPVNEDFGIPNRDEVASWAMFPAREPGAGYQGQDFVSISGGTGWALNPNTPHPAEAWELLAFLSSKEFADYQQTTEPRISFRDDVEILADPQVTDMADALLPLTTVRPLLPEYPQVSYEVQLMTERVITGEMTPAEAMAAYDEAVTAIVGEDNVIRVQ